MPTEAERRVAPRAKLFQPAELRRGHAGAPVERAHLLNLSSSGALVYARAGIAAGTPVHLDCGIPLGRARVAWSDGPRFGVAFDLPLSEAQIAAVLQTQAGMIARFEQRRRAPDVPMAPVAVAEMAMPVQN